MIIFSLPNRSLHWKVLCDASSETTIDSDGTIGQEEEFRCRTKAREMYVINGTKYEG